MAAPTIGLALGGGAARGLAHIIVLEALESLGVRPAVIAASSMGALVGAAYASGIPAADIRRHALDVLGNPRSAARRIPSVSPPVCRWLICPFCTTNTSRVLKP